MLFKHCVIKCTVNENKLEFRRRIHFISISLLKFCAGKAFWNEKVLVRKLSFLSIEREFYEQILVQFRTIIETNAALICHVLHLILRHNKKQRRHHVNSKQNMNDSKLDHRHANTTSDRKMYLTPLLTFRASCSIHLSP